MGPHGERELALHVGGAPQLEDFNCAPTPLSLEHVAQDHHVVGNKFFNAVAGNRSVLVDALSRHHRGDANFLEPRDQPKDLTTYDENSVVLLEHRRNRINGDTLGLVLADGVVNPLDQTREIKTSRHILAVGIWRGIKDEKLVLLDHLLQVPAKTGGVAQDVEGRFLEGDENARFVKILDAVV